MAPVSLVTIHHEGLGNPRNDLTEPGKHGYSVGIGTTEYTMFRSPFDSFATLHFNHVSFDVLLSGDRSHFQITQSDTDLLRAACADARKRGWLVDQPYVRPHRESPGSQTVCPGNNAAYPDPPEFPAGNALAWVALVTACHKEVPPLPPATTPEFFPPLDTVDFCAFKHPTRGPAAAALTPDGHVFCQPPDAYMGSPFDDTTGKPKSYWGDRKGSRIAAGPKGEGYVITATSSETYGPKF